MGFDVVVCFVVGMSREWLFFCGRGCRCAFRKNKGTFDALLKPATPACSEPNRQGWKPREDLCFLFSDLFSAVWGNTVDLNWLKMGNER